MKRRLSFILVALLACDQANAANYHLVGWFNTFVPGGGQLLLGDPAEAALQAGIEISTFGYGYYRSGRTPFTLDGAPEQLPSHGTISSTKVTRTTICLQYDSHHRCIKSKTSTSSSTTSSADQSEQSLVVPLYADILQEIGLKYHMVNVYNSYREAAFAAGDGGMLDKTSTGDLFLAPFKADNLLDPWVWGALLVSAGAVVYNYSQSINSYNTAIAPLTPYSNTLYAIDYGLVFPTGSGAPEEMFYRGFLQNEFYHLVPSPFFSIPVTTLLYTFSHSSDARPSAAITGAYLSFLVHKDHGALSKGIAYHFWADIFAGISEIFILRNAETLNPSPLLSFQFEF